MLSHGGIWFAARNRPLDLSTRLLWPACGLHQMHMNHLRTATRQADFDQGGMPMSRTAMVTIHWLSRYETGIPEIDAQHHRLFEVVNELIDAFRRGESNSQVAKVIDYLLSYTNEHSRTEEDWMERLHFPGLEEHRQEHQDFLNRILELKWRFDSGERMAMDVTVLLADWLEYHVNAGDRVFAEYSRGVNTP